MSFEEFSMNMLLCGWSSGNRAKGELIYWKKGNDMAQVIRGISKKLTGETHFAHEYVHNVHDREARQVRKANTFYELFELVKRYAP